MSKGANRWGCGLPTSCRIPMMGLNFWSVASSKCGFGGGKGQLRLMSLNGRGVKEGEQAFHQLTRIPENVLCFTVRHVSGGLSFLLTQALLNHMCTAQPSPADLKVSSWSSAPHLAGSNQLPGLAWETRLSRELTCLAPFLLAIFKTDNFKCSSLKE